MSWAVEDWVWRRCTVEDDLQRNVLLAIAWHCPRDDGLDSRASLVTLAEMVHRDHKAVTNAIRALEAAGELIVWRTAVTIRGRRPGNRYAVVMDRPVDDVLALAQTRHRPPAEDSSPGTDQAPGTDQDAATARPGKTFRRRSADAPPTLRGRSRSERAEGVDLDPDPDLRRASAARSSPARARPPDSRLDPLRAELAGLDVSWQMTDEQVAAMAALVEVHGPRRLAAVALDLVTDRGRPTFARAWLGTWRALPPPGGPARTSDVPQPRAESAWCRSCESDTYRWVVDDDGLPLRPCPSCHPTSRQEAPF
jgi:hypothetical protein